MSTFSTTDLTVSDSDLIGTYPWLQMQHVPPSFPLPSPFCRMFYGPGGPYALFAGRDASRALAKMSFETSDLTSDISGLSPFEAEALQEWEYKFKSKYVTVGTIKKTTLVAEEDSTSTVTTERDI